MLDTYFYISDRKVETYHAQVPQNILLRPAVQRDHVQSIPALDRPRKLPRPLVLVPLISARRFHFLHQIRPARRRPLRHPAQHRHRQRPRTPRPPAGIMMFELDEIFRLILVRRLRP